MLRGVMTAIASLVVAACAAAGAWAHEGVETAAGHALEDSVGHTAAQERALDDQTRAVTAFAAGAAAAAAAGSPHDEGQWGPVVNWPVVGVHVALLSNGKVLAYDSVGDNAAESYPVHNYTRATVWDPETGIQTPVNVDTGFNVFCSGLAHLLDGRLFLAGGNKNQQLNGIVQTHLFESATNTWSLGPNMATGRWYPTVTPLRNGEMLITSGYVSTPEVRMLTGGLRTLSTASLSLPLYPWMDVAPDGRAFYSGPDQTMRALDTSGTGTWQSLGQRDTINRDYGGHALFDVGKILVAGGGPSSKDTRVIDLNGPTPAVSTTAPMAYGRRQHNLTVLADGSVLATGGNSSGAGLVDLNAGVYPAEQWSPDTGQWRTLAPMQITRQYHSSALLLADGRVLSSGGGSCGTCDQVGYLAKNAEIFSPPYLFQADGTLAPRPAIDYGAGRRNLRRADRDHDRQPSVHSQGGSRPPRRCHALGQHGAALCPAVVHCRRDEHHRHHAGQCQYRPTGALHALHPRRERRAFGCPHGQHPERLATDRHAHTAGKRHVLHCPRHDQPHRNSRRRRRHYHQDRVLQRPDQTRRIHKRAVCVQLGWGDRRHLHDHRPRHRQPRRERDERIVHDHSGHGRHGRHGRHTPTPHRARPWSPSRPRRALSPLSWRRLCCRRRCR